MTAFSWGKHFIGMISDDKFLAAADIAGVTPLLPPVVFSALFERAIENHDGGSFAGFRPRVLAAKFRVAVEDVERVIAAFVELAIIEGQRLVNWAKRQGEAVAKLAKTTAKKVGAQVRRSSSTPRTRKHRAQQREAERQMSLLLPINGTRVSSPDGDDGTPVPAPEEEEERERSPEIDSSAAQALKEDEGKNDKGGSGERCALSAADAARKAEKRTKRANLIKTLRRWVRYSGELDNADQVHRLLMLDRAEAALDCWEQRETPDKVAFDFLTTRAWRRPLAKEWVAACEQAERAEARARMAAGWGTQAEAS